jgi:Rab-like protein 3
MTSYDKVKIVVAGDSGVGKTSAVHLICHGQGLQSPAWTVGCSLNVKLHEYQAGTRGQKTYFIDFWDIGGSLNHANSRSVFYNGVNGIILVHDLTNRKSESNLGRWVMEIVNHENSTSRFKLASSPSLSGSSTSLNDNSSVEFDPETFAGTNHIPILVIATKLDAYLEAKSAPGHGSRRQEIPSTVPMRRSAIAEECQAEEIYMTCMDNKSLAPGSTAAAKLGRFLDIVIDRRFHRETTTFYDRKRTSHSHTSPKDLSNRIY